MTGVAPCLVVTQKPEQRRAWRGTGGHWAEAIYREMGNEGVVPSRVSHV